MANKTTDNIKLGLLVTAGVIILVVSLYLIGKNQSLFGSTFHLRARFTNVNGLMAGNNIRYSGIQAGTVNKITIINDTTIEVDLLIEDEMKPFIRKNALVSIGNEGLMGNKVINITPSRIPADPVEEGELLLTKNLLVTDDMLNTLSNTNDNVEVISGNLITTVNRINESRALWRILNDTTLSDGLRLSMHNLQIATENINEMSVSLLAVIKDAKSGNGAVGAIIANDTLANNLKAAVANINAASKESVAVLAKLDSIASVTHRSIENGNGVVHALLKDPAMVKSVNTSLNNVEKGTVAFEESMQALKNNFLFRGYFRKVEKRKNKVRKSVTDTTHK